MKRSHYATGIKNFVLFAAGILFSASAAAQVHPLLVINANQFYPASGYASAIGNQNVPAGFQQLIFQSDSGRIISGQLTIRCRGGYEHRNVSLYGGYNGATLQNPCASNQLVNFDLYLASPTMQGSFDRIRVYGYGYIPTPVPPTPGPGPGGPGDLLANLSFNQFYPASGYMAIGGLNLQGGYRTYRFISTDHSPVRGQLTIRCGNKEYRNYAISNNGNKSFFNNPCDLNRGLNIDIYLTSPYVGPGTHGRIQIRGQR